MKPVRITPTQDAIIADDKLEKNEPSFNDDLERMQKMVNSEDVNVPDFDNFEDFDRWLMSL
ncbi:hypothetical protein B0186_11515 [Canicola haemoglobinophilus]|uniref:Uncharacterized protein n=1 Tax=Canicola haemoglobinophilus TaxID=733 RepID=A0A1V4AY84_9PAST|nr:hypothetical protein [Canicola haemoglobinophilus]OOR94504.1 hypothetical protein B0186_11515 [Canicola haemoglobinophilus]STO60665.1 Uncharacterised protein [Canicola haemoglobinophilus]